MRLDRRNQPLGLGFMIFGEAKDDIEGKNE